MGEIVWFADDSAVLHEVQFHYSSFTQAPFEATNLMHDNLHQAVPNGILQIQPELGENVASFVETFTYEEFRKGSAYGSRDESSL